ncbi:MAG: alpha/beta hydrolase [Caulobacteraceae bacterium]
MPTSILARAETFAMTAKANGHAFSISLARPMVETPDSPIVIVLDAGVTFGTATEAATFRGAMGALSPAVVVGVGYDADMLTTLRLRTRDLTPPAPADKYLEMAAMMGTEFGGADAFLSFLLDDLIPEVRRRAPEASETRRVLFGHSLGGLFAAHALLTRPESFETFVASSPSLWWNDFATLKLVDGFAARLAERGASPRVLVEIAAREQDEPDKAAPGLTLEVTRERVREARMVDTGREFAETLKGFPLAELKFVCFEDEDHASVMPAAVGRAMTFALTPRQE